jgi:hypothetical protein
MSPRLPHALRIAELTQKLHAGRLTAAATDAAFAESDAGAGIGRRANRIRPPE